MPRANYLLAGLLSVVLGGCNSEDTGRLERIGQKIAGRVEKMTAGNNSKLTRGWKALRNGWDEDPIDVRVSTRLRWDRELAGCKIEVMRQGDMVELTGVVPNEAAHQRAIDLAESTIGVKSVADWLEEAEQEPNEKSKRSATAPPD
jgi:hypothetical protein